MSSIDGADTGHAASGHSAPNMGLSTFRSFSLLRDGVRQVLECSSSGASSFKAIRENTRLGTVQVEAMPRFAKAAGLLDQDGSLTRVGRALLEKDPALADCRSQWLVHYNLVSPYTTGPDFWRELFDYVASRSVVTPDEVRSYLQDCAGTEVGERALKYAYVAFVGTYTKSECLGSLGLLAEENDTLNVGQGRIPPPPVVTYVIADYWDHVWPGRQSVNLGWLSDPGGPGSLLLMNSGEIGEVLKEMQNAGLVELQRRQAPYQVFRLWKDTAELLERVHD